MCDVWRTKVLAVCKTKSLHSARTLVKSYHQEAPARIFFAMPTDYRAELHSLRAEHGDLVRRFEVLTTEHARTLRDRRNTVSQLLRVKRDNMLLAAALRGKAGAVAAMPMASHAMSGGGRRPRATAAIGSLALSELRHTP